MNRITNLIQSAEKQRRILWASLPFQTRLAELLFRIAFDPKETFGRMVYTIFLQRHVKGLPPVKGVPAELFDVTKAPGRQAPPGYGKDFGAKVWASAIAKFKDPELVQDAMSDVMLKLTHRPDLISASYTLSHAQAYVMKAVITTCLGRIRTINRKREDSLSVPTPQDAMFQPDRVVDIVDNETLNDILQRVDEHTLDAMRDALRNIPGAVPYFDAVLEGGYADNEITGDYRKGIPAAIPWFQEHPMVPTNLPTRIKPKMRQVLKKFFTRHFV